MMSLMRGGAIRFHLAALRQPTTMLTFGRNLSTSLANNQGDKYTAVHFRLSGHAHPLKMWKNPTQNHVWAEDEVDEALAVQTHVEPKTFLDKLIYFSVRGAYHTFNFITGYKKDNPTPLSIQIRLLFLESIAGVPGMVAASMRHFRSLRTMQRDHGWIHTLLEEAENERMHLLVFMNVFKPNVVTRVLVMAGQVVLVTALTGVYAVHPQALHRFVGYLEETAVSTYTDVIKVLQTPGSELNKAWKGVPAPEIAKHYWRLPDDAMFVDVIRHIAADETHHRDVNHTFASMSTGDVNPFVEKHLVDAALAWRSPTLIEDAERRVPRGIA